MWLLDSSSLDLRDFIGDEIPQYAILSHTWGKEEASHAEWLANDPSLQTKAGFRKVRNAAKKALSAGHQWLWIDTICIDKRMLPPSTQFIPMLIEALRPGSSAELSEAINSMFTWYQDAKICYAYLEDVSTTEQIVQSRWFTRGWTLQELLAPRTVNFLNKDWEELGTKQNHLSSIISQAARIDEIYLRNSVALRTASVARKLSWAARRKTTRVEDMAYCLLGLFNINMPLLYGEGHKAFIRLQKEIIQDSADQTLFCWHWTSDVPEDWTSLIAPSPTVFADAGHYVKQNDVKLTGGLKPYSVTNLGLSIEMTVVYNPILWFGILNARDSTKDLQTAVMIPLERMNADGQWWHSRSSFPPKPLTNWSTLPVLGARLEEHFPHSPRTSHKLHIRRREDTSFHAMVRGHIFWQEVELKLRFPPTAIRETRYWVLPLLDLPHCISESVEIRWGAGPGAMPLSMLFPRTVGGGIVYSAWIKFTVDTWTLCVMAAAVDGPQGLLWGLKARRTDSAALDNSRLSKLTNDENADLQEFLQDVRHSRQDRFKSRATIKYDGPTVRPLEMFFGDDVSDDTKNVIRPLFIKVSAASWERVPKVVDGTIITAGSRLRKVLTRTTNRHQVEVDSDEKVQGKFQEDYPETMKALAKANIKDV